MRQLAFFFNGLLNVIKVFHKRASYIYSSVHVLAQLSSNHITRLLLQTPAINRLIQVFRKAVEPRDTESLVSFEPVFYLRQSGFSCLKRSHTN